MKKRTLILGILLSLTGILTSSELIGFWPINEGAGNLIHDCSGKNHHGRLISPSPETGKWITTPTRNYFLFNNPEKNKENGHSRIELPCPENFDISSVFSVVFNVKTPSVVPDRSRQYELINFTRTFNPPNGFRICYAWDSFWLHIGANQLNRIETTTSRIIIRPDTWYSVAVTYNQGEVILFVNGQIMCQKSGVKVSRNTKKFILGASGKKYYGFEGILSDVFIYRKALSVSEVIKIYAGK